MTALDANLSIHRTDAGAVMTPNVSGGITCSKHPASGGWCEDIKWALDERHDALSVWAHGMSVDPWNPHVKVPIMPTRSIWAIVRLHRVDDSLLRAVKTEPHRRDGSDHPSLGFISYGEGRMILREMILEWFEPHLNIDKHACCSMEHTARKTMLVAQSCRTDPVSLFVNCWTMHHFDTCEHCWNGGRRAPRPRFPTDLFNGM